MIYPSRQAFFVILTGGGGSIYHKRVEWPDKECAESPKEMLCAEVVEVLGSQELLPVIRS